MQASGCMTGGAACFGGRHQRRRPAAAAQANDSPWPNHGVQTAYEFAHDVGGLDPSMYFGFRKE